MLFRSRAHRDSTPSSVQEACERSEVSLGWCQVHHDYDHGAPSPSRVLSPLLHRIPILLSNSSRVPIPVNISIPRPFRCLCMALMHPLVCASSCVLVRLDGHLCLTPSSPLLHRKLESGFTREKPVRKNKIKICYTKSGLIAGKTYSSVMSP